MKATMSVTLDTTWTNQVVARVECELDNPHSITARMLSELMVARLRTLAEEVRHANERAVPEMMDETEGERGGRDRSRGGDPERERQAYEELRQNRETEEQLRGGA